LVNLDGVYSIGIKANGDALASYTLRVRPVPPSLVSFDGGSALVSDQAAGAWRYFRIEVPVGCMGWDLRLTNVTSGQPQLVVRRDRLPNEVVTSSGNVWPDWYYGPTAYTNWPSGYQWAPLTDWTARAWSHDGTTNEDGRVLIASFGNPLEPGTYYVGVCNVSGSGQPANYTFTSRGIGAGLVLPVVDLAFTGGSATHPGLTPREAAHYRVTVPPGATSWQVKLEVTEGDAMLAVHQTVLPAAEGGAAARAVFPPASSGRHMRKAGNEHFVLLPEDGQTELVAGDYFLSVVSEGQEPGWSQIGTNATRYAITSVGEPISEW
jgi:large repetitive protein